MLKYWSVLSFYQMNYSNIGAAYPDAADPIIAAESASVNDAASEIVRAMAPHSGITFTHDLEGQPWPVNERWGDWRAPYVAHAESLGLVVKVDGCIQFTDKGAMVKALLIEQGHVLSAPTLGTVRCWSYTDGASDVV